MNSLARTSMARDDLKQAWPPPLQTLLFEFQDLFHCTVPLYTFGLGIQPMKFRLSFYAFNGAHSRHYSVWVSWCPKQSPLLDMQCTILFVLYFNFCNIKWLSISSFNCGALIQRLFLVSGAYGCHKDWQLGQEILYYHVFSVILLLGLTSKLLKLQDQLEVNVELKK